MRAIRGWLIAVFAFSALAAPARAEDQMPWQPNLETAKQIAAQSRRLVLIHFWAPWCQPCMRLEREVFSHAETARALDGNFVLVKLNIDESPGTARLYGVTSLPTDVIILPNGKKISQFQSPPTANQYVTQMNQAAATQQELARKAAPQVSAYTPQAPPAMAAPPGPQGAAPSAYEAMPVAAASPVAGQVVAQGAPPPGTYPNERYAEYFRQQPGAQTPTGQPPAAAVPLAQQAPLGPAGQQPPSAPQAAPAAGPPAAPQFAAQQPAAPQGYNMRTPYQPQMPQLPPGCPPVALDGNCPVTLVERMQWAMGDKAWGAVHRGRTYLFLGPEEREKFLANPDLYAPVMSGMDPVLALDQQVAVPGKREFGVFGSDRRIYLFADEASLKRFEQNQKRYAAEAIQARR